MERKATEKMKGKGRSKLAYNQKYKINESFQKDTKETLLVAANESGISL